MSTQSKDLGHGITLIDAQYIQPGIAAVYLMRHQGHAAIIETGTSFTAAAIIDTLSHYGLKTEDVRYIIPTHVHLDHAGGAGELMAICNNAQLVIHPYGAQHMIDPSRLIEGAKTVYGEDKFKQLYGAIKPVPASRVIEASDNFEIDLEGRTLKFLDTPGHARHHFCIVDQMSHGIFSGDTFGLSYPQLNTAMGPFMFATTTPVQFDPDALLNSIDRLIALKPKSIYLTHFGRISPTDHVVTQLKDSIQAFVSIALQEKNNPNNREAHIESQIMKYLLDKLEQFHTTMHKNVSRPALAMDVKLNAQGLEIWLQKMEKAQ